MRLLQLRYEVEPANCNDVITELTMKHFLVGVTAQISIKDQEEKKRDLKAKVKEERPSGLEMPLKLNFN